MVGSKVKETSQVTSGDPMDHKESDVPDPRKACLN
jgi:hypothetical protein